MKRLDFLKSLIVAPAAAKAVLDSPPRMLTPIVRENNWAGSFDEFYKHWQVRFNDRVVELEVKDILEIARRTGILVWEKGDRFPTIHPLRSFEE